MQETWSETWQSRTKNAIFALGFDSVRAFAEAYPRDSFLKLAELVPPAAAIQIESLLRDEARFYHQPGIGDRQGRNTQFRSELGLATEEGTIARLDVGGYSFYGINAHGQQVNMRVNAITLDEVEVITPQGTLIFTP